MPSTVRHKYLHFSLPKRIGLPTGNDPVNKNDEDCFWQVWTSEMLAESKEDYSRFGYWEIG